MTNWQKMAECSIYSVPSMRESKRWKARKAKKTAKKQLDSTLKSYQEDLVKRITPAEQAFMDKLTELKIKFEFQKIFKANRENYIVDFYLPDYHIIAEIDGEYHNDPEQKQKDKIRSKNLRTNLVVSKIVRFTNNTALAPGNHKTILQRLFPETKCHVLTETEPTRTRSNLVQMDKRSGTRRVAGA